MGISTCTPTYQLEADPRTCPPGEVRQIHWALMIRLGVRRIAFAASGFERLAGVGRLDPMDVVAWRFILSL